MRRLTPGRTPSSLFGQRYVAEKNPLDKTLSRSPTGQVNYVEKRPRLRFAPSKLRGDKHKTRQTTGVAATLSESAANLPLGEKALGADRLGLCPTKAISLTVKPEISASNVDCGH